MNPKNPCSVSTLKDIVTFVAMDKAVNTFRTLDHQNTPGKTHQNIAHIIFTMGEQPLNPVKREQEHKPKNGISKMFSI